MSDNPLLEINDILIIAICRGEIHLNISLATSPRFNLMDCPASKSVHQSGPGELQFLTPRPPAPVCTLPPVHVNIRAGGDPVIVHYDDWKTPSRELRMDVFSLIGDVQSKCLPVYIPHHDVK